MLPLRIEAEDYRTGANGVTYVDFSTGNSGGAFRNDDVDIEASSEGGYDVGWIESGEWLSFDITVPEDGVYQLTARVASEWAGGQFQASVGDQTTTASFDATGGWQNWISEAGDGNLSLSAGSHVLRLDMLASDFNVNWLELEKVEQPARKDVFCYEAEQGQLSGSFIVRPDSQASNDAYVEATKNYDGILQFDIENAEAGDYTLTARVLAPTHKDNSFFVKVNGGDAQVWHIDPATGWQDAEFGPAITLQDGANTVEILAREDGTGIDSFGLRKSDLDLCQYDLIWSDEFDGASGARPAPHWFFFDGWGAGTWRDATYTEDDAYLDGDGHLVMRARVEDGALTTSYLQTYDWPAPVSQWTTFGPGDGKYIEASIQLNELEAGGPWPAFWLFDPSGTYDGDPSTGTEIDIFEYPVSAGLESSWTRWLPNGTFNHFGVANHWGESESAYLHAADFGVDLRDGAYHKFGVEWTEDKLTYYLDGIEVWSTENGVSTSDGQAILLSIEYDATNDPWGLDEHIEDYLDILPDYFLVDYVRVYETAPESSGFEGSVGSDNDLGQDQLTVDDPLIA